MKTYKKARYTAQLPPTPCTPEMRQRMIDVAEEKGESVAHLQREAIALFLSENDRNSIINESVPSETSTPADHHAHA
jgi:hypothetical protein